MSPLQQTLFPCEDARAPEKAAPSAVAPPAQREAFLRERLLAKLQAAQNHEVVSQGSGAWDTSMPGLRVLSLKSSADHRTLRIDMATQSGFTRPDEETRHECWVLRGELRLGGTVLRAGDFLAAPQQEPAARWSSAGGAQLLLIAWLNTPA
ncbi:MAG: hypothetical protein HEQ39_14660 [Rhizobacter sp.]